MLALTLLLCAPADLPPQPRAAADLVITGTIEKLTTKSRKWATDGEQTAFTARVKVDRVEKGKGVKPGEVIEVTWHAVTRVPSMPPLKYAHGQLHPVKEKDAVRMWVVRPSVGPPVIIYNKQGVEKVKK